MPKQYKCPICGSTEYYNIPGHEPSQITRVTKNNYEDGYIVGQTTKTVIIEHRNLFNIGARSNERVDVSFIVNAEICLCKNCGHLDFFNEEMLLDIKTNEKSFRDLLNQKQKDMNDLNEKINDKKNEEINLEKSIIDYETKIKDENITIKQQNQYLQELDVCKEKIKIVKKENYKLDKMREALKEELSDVKFRLDNVARIDEIK